MLNQSYLAFFFFFVANEYQGFIDMDENMRQKNKVMPMANKPSELSKDRISVPSEQQDQADVLNAESKNSKLTGADLLNLIFEDKSEQVCSENFLSPDVNKFIDKGIFSQEDIKADQNKILSSEIFKTFNENTKKFEETINWSPSETNAFLQRIDENNKDVFKFFDTLNDELDRDLLIWQEDLNIINHQLELWNIAGISMDVTRTETKVNIARKWLSLKEREVAECVKKTSSVKKSIKDSIRKLCNEKENMF